MCASHKFHFLIRLAPTKEFDAPELELIEDIVESEEEEVDEEIVQVLGWNPYEFIASLPEKPAHPLMPTPTSFLLPKSTLPDRLTLGTS